MSQRIVFQWPCCTSNFQVDPKLSFLALCPCAGLLWNNSHSLEFGPVARSWQRGHSWNINTLHWFFFISVANSGSIILLWKAFHNSFGGHQDLISRRHKDDEGDSFEEAGTHAQNTIIVRHGVNTLFTKEEKCLNLAKWLKQGPTYQQIEN